MRSSRVFRNITAVIIFLIVLAVGLGWIGKVDGDVLHKIIRFSFDQIEEKILSENKDYHLLEMRKKRLSIQQKSAQERYDDLMDSAPITNRIQAEMQLRQANRAIMTMEYQKAMQEEILKYRTEVLYITCLNLKQQLEAQKKNLNLMEKIYKIDQVRYEQGLITANDLRQAELQLEKARLMVENIRNSQQNALDQLKALTGFPLDQSLELEDIEGITIEEIHLNEAIEKAITTGFDVILKQMEYDWKVADRDYYQSQKGTENNDYKMAKIDAEEAEIKLKQAIENAKMKVEDAYGKAKVAAQSYQLAERSLKLAHDQLRSAEKRYDLGMISGLDLIREQLDLMKAQQEYDEARLDYFKALKTFKLAENGIAIGE